MIQEINKELLIYLNSFTNYNFIQNIVLYFADTPIFFLPLFLWIMWLLYTYKKNISIIKNIQLNKKLNWKESLLYIFYSVIIWIIISLSIQQIIHVDRPEEAIKWVWKLLLNHIPDASFPSDHATVSVAFLTSLFLAWYKNIWFIFFPFVILMLISRVILWVHWPLDIIAWSMVWIISSLITFKYLINIQIINKINKMIINTMKYIKL